MLPPKNPRTRALVATVCTLTLIFEAKTTAWLSTHPKHHVDPILGHTLTPVGWMFVSGFVSGIALIFALQEFCVWRRRHDTPATAPATEP